MKWSNGIVALFVLMVMQSAGAQNIDVKDPFGPSGTHTSIPTTPTTWTYNGSVVATHDFTYTFKVKHNGTWKLTHVQSVVNPPAEWFYSKVVDFSTWGVQNGQTLTFYAMGKLLPPYQTTTDTDYLYGDMYTPVSFNPDTQDPFRTLFAALAPSRRETGLDLGDNA